MPFSVYLKPWQQPWGFDVDVLANLQPLFVIPLQGVDWHEGIGAMRDPQLTAELAAHANTTIPDATRGTGKVLDDYRKSNLAKFHEWFYSQEQHPAELWPDTYDRQPLEILPTCARVALETPNDLLLRPAFIRRLVRVMLALGWHPRHIAGLICSKYRAILAGRNSSMSIRRRAPISTRAFSPACSQPGLTIWPISTVSRLRSKARAHFQTADSICWISKNPLWKGERMTSWPIGLSTGCFYHRNILDCLPLIRESGFSMVEVCSTPEHLNFHDLKSVHRAAERIRELGMEAYSFHAPFAPQDRHRFLRRRTASCLCCRNFQGSGSGCDFTSALFCNAPGPENPATIPATEQLPRMQHVVDSLNQVARRCKELGIMCVLENKLPHLLFGNTSDILWILDGINSAEVGVCLDTGHAYLGGDIHNLVHKLSGHLRMIHAHDNGGADDNHWPPGDGKIDWEKFMRDLIEVRFRGAFILEMAGNNDPAVTMTNARRGRSYLRDTGRRLALTK